MINPEKLLEVGIDYNAGMERFMNDADLYEAVLNAFLSENILDKSMVAFKNKDDEMLSDIIHEAKGSSGNAGFDDLYAVSSGLVGLLRSKSYTRDELAESYDKFEKLYKKIRNGIIIAIQ